MLGLSKFMTYTVVLKCIEYVNCRDRVCFGQSSLTTDGDGGDEKAIWPEDSVNCFLNRNPERGNPVSIWSW